MADGGRRPASRSPRARGTTARRSGVTGHPRSCRWPTRPRMSSRVSVSMASSSLSGRPMGSPPPAIHTWQKPSSRALKADASTAGSPGRAWPRIAQSLKMPPHGGEPGVPHRGEALGECRVGLGCLTERADLREVRAVGVPVGGYPGAQGRPCDRSSPAGSAASSAPACASHSASSARRMSSLPAKCL